MSSLDRLAELRAGATNEEKSGVVDPSLGESPPIVPEPRRASVSLHRASKSLSSMGLPISRTKQAIARYATFNNLLATITLVTTQLRNLSTQEKLATNQTLRQQIETELERLMSQGTESGRLARKEIEDISRENNNFFGTEGSDVATTQIRTNLILKAQRDYTNTMKEYHAVLNEFQTSLRKRSARDIRLVDPTLSDAKVDSLVDSGEASKFFQSQLLADGDIDEIDIEERVSTLERRHSEINRLEKEVQMVAELFRDLALMVESQQETIDVIDKKVMSAKNATGRGEVSVVEAEKKLSTSRKLQFLLFVFLIIILAAIIVPVAIVKSRQQDDD